MTKFLFYGLLCSLGVLGIACSTIMAIIKIDSICNVSCINQRLTKSPPFLNIQKLGVRKQITSPEKQFFNCYIDKTCMELHVADSNYSCKETLSKLSGHICTQDVGKRMTFCGTGGVLNYQDYTLNIYNCRFRLQQPDQGESEEYATGGMKTLSLSLRK